MDHIACFLAEGVYVILDLSEAVTHDSVWLLQAHFVTCYWGSTNEVEGVLTMHSLHEIPAICFSAHWNLMTHRWNLLSDSHLVRKALLSMLRSWSGLDRFLRYKKQVISYMFIQEWLRSWYARRRISQFAIRLVCCENGCGIFPRKPTRQQNCPVLESKYNSC